MNKWKLVICLLSLMLLGQVTQAAPAPQLVQQVDIVADRSVTPLDYSFFDEPGPGKVELYNVKNLWGAGAKMIVYLVTDEGPEWLVLGFGGGMIEIRLQNRNLPLFSERISKISQSSPLVLTVREGQLKVAIGSKSFSVRNVTAFKGSLTTQSIEATLKAYRFTD